MRETLLDRIWLEMKQASTNFFYAALLLDKEKSWNVIYKTITTTIVSCIVWYMSKEEYAGLGAGFVTFLLSDTKWFRPFFLREPDELEKIRNLCTVYRIYFNQLQNIFDKLLSENINNNDAQATYSDIYEANALNQTDISIAFGKIDKKINKIAAKKSDDYLMKIYYGK